MADDENSLRISEKALKDLSEITTLQEAVTILEKLDLKQISLLIQKHKEYHSQNYKNNEISQIISSTSDPQDLKSKIKEHAIILLNDQLQRIKDEIKSRRKKGEDVELEDIASMKIPLKIKVYSVTGNLEDYNNIKKLIETLKKSLNIE